MKEAHYGLFKVNQEEPLVVSTEATRDVLRRVAQKNGTEYFVARLEQQLEAVRGRERE